MFNFCLGGANPLKEFSKVNIVNKPFKITFIIFNVIECIVMSLLICIVKFSSSLSIAKLDPIISPTSQ